MNKKIFKNTKPIIITMVAIVIISIPIFIRVYKVVGGSMYPTLENGDLILVDRLSIKLLPPKRGELLVFHNPHKPKEVLVKRVIGLPGETVFVKPNKIIIGRSCDGTNIEKTPAPTKLLPRDGPCQKTYMTGSLIGREGGAGFTMTMYLGVNDYFLMGDDRRDSADSRIFGAVQPSDIIGRID